MAVCRATTTIISYLLMVKKFTTIVLRDSECKRIIGHKGCEPVAVCTTAHKYIIFFMLYIIVVMAPKTTTTGLLTTTFVK